MNVANLLQSVQEQHGALFELLEHLHGTHMLLRQVDWSIRFHDRATVDYFLRLSEYLVQDDERE